MNVDIHTFQPTPADDARASELIDECRERIGGEWKLVSSSIKLTKSIFEADYDGKRVVGKASKSKRAAGAHRNAQRLHSAGMRPPSRFTVPEPVAWFEDLGLLVLEKAPGQSVLEALQQPKSAIEPALKAAEWLHSLHVLKFDASEDPFDAAGADRRARELAACLGNRNVVELASKATAILARTPKQIVPTHGDYHPMNIYVAPHRVTAIDLDTIALRDAETDIGYFLAQAANFGLQMFDSFDATRSIRQRFRACFPDADEERIAAHSAWALLRSVHYDVCILKIENKHIDRMIEASGKLLV